MAGLFPVIDEQAGGTGRGGRLLWAPAPPALTGGLDIARSFRTLKRGAPSRSRSILDTDATIRRIAEEGIWEPVFQPTTDRWLDLALVLDVGPSMDVWRSILDSLRKLLESLGVFGRVKMWSWDTGPVRPLLAPGYGRGGARDWNHNSLELVEAGGRQLILVLTDCVSEAWFSGEATRVLAEWAERGPVAIVQMLPESLWPRTALGPAAQVHLKSPYPAALNRKLAAKFVNPLLIPDDEGTDSVRADSLLIPVVTRDRGSLQPWAAMLTAAGEAWAPGLRLEVPARARPGSLGSDLAEQVPSAAGPSAKAPDPEQAVGRFLLVSSEGAQDLARHLAAAPVITLPIIRLIRRTLLRSEGDQVHEAEVLLGGLLRAVGSPAPSVDPEQVYYDFHEGVRSRLLDVLPTSDARRVLSAVSGYIEDRLGQEPGTIRTLLADPRAKAGSWKTSDAPIAEILVDVLSRLGGDYSRLAQQLRRYGEATVLWVDDRPDDNPNRHARQQFEALGVRIILSTSTEDALAKTQHRTFDAIISDMGRPPDPRAGYTLLDALRARGDQTPFIIYAGARADKDVKESLLHGALGCTNSPQELIEMVLEALGKGMTR